MGSLVLSYEQLKPKKRAFLTGSLVAMVTYCVKITNESYLAIIFLSNDTILLSLSDILEFFYNAIKQQAL